MNVLKKQLEQRESRNWNELNTRIGDLKGVIHLQRKENGNDCSSGGEGLCTGD